MSFVGPPSSPFPPSTNIICDYDILTRGPSTNQTAKSKKQRRLALKRQRQQEERILASGNLEALAPKIPLHKQSVNLTAAEAGDVQQAMAAVDERETLRKAMRKDRKANIKESNYLKSM